MRTFAHIAGVLATSGFLLASAAHADEVTGAATNWTKYDGPFAISAGICPVAKAPYFHIRYFGGLQAAEHLHYWYRINGVEQRIDLHAIPSGPHSSRVPANDFLIVYGLRSVGDCFGLTVPGRTEESSHAWRVSEKEISNHDMEFEIAVSDGQSWDSNSGRNYRVRFEENLIGLTYTD